MMSTKTQLLRSLYCCIKHNLHSYSLFPLLLLVFRLPPISPSSSPPLLLPTPHPHSPHLTLTPFLPSLVLLSHLSHFPLPLFYLPLLLPFLSPTLPSLLPLPPPHRHSVSSCEPSTVQQHLYLCQCHVGSSRV